MVLALARCEAPEKDACTTLVEPAPVRGQPRCGPCVSVLADAEPALRGLPVAESYVQAAHRTAVETCRKWLEALAPETASGRGVDGKATLDVERIINCLVRLREAARGQLAHEAGGSPEAARRQPAGSLNGGTFKEGASTRQSSKKQDSRKPLYSEDFLAAFWCHWKWRGSKMLASQEWEKLSAEDRELVTADLVKKRRGERDPSWVKDGGRFVVAAERYLKRRLWEEQWEAGAESRVLGDDGEVPR